MTTRRPAVRLFDVDPELARRLPPETARLARRHAVTRTVYVERGAWAPAIPAEAVRGHLGLLIVDGLLMRDMAVGRTGCTELLGTGDLLRPWEEDAPDVVPHTVTWEALAGTTLAILDRRFAQVASHWPELIDALMARMVRRSRALTLDFAVSHLTRVDDRLTVMLWHLADRWGHVSPEGVVLPLKLTHQTLARLVGAQRPSVTTALGDLRRAGMVGRSSDGSWVLHGSPDALAERLAETGRGRRPAFSSAA